uniref:Uncharacterized protein n=1 Tax=Anguilla anguilla TaxID=7936 RepID=A0A0E9X4H1_ANGAN
MYITGKGGSYFVVNLFYVDWNSMYLLRIIVTEPAKWLSDKFKLKMCLLSAPNSICLFVCTLQFSARHGVFTCLFVHTFCRNSTCD